MNRGREKYRRSLLYDDPVECGTCTTHGRNNLSNGVRTVSQIHRSPSVIATYGIFVGHGAATAADLCARNFVPTLLGDSFLETVPENAIRNTFLALEAFVNAKSNLDKTYYGTTALFAMVKDGSLYIANIGDSRAVLYTEDGVQTITKEHDGSNAEEVARVRNAGGFFENGKVNNVIRVTRSIGDLELKSRKHLAFPTLRMREDIVIATPDVFHRSLSARDKFVVLATAEVWEHMSNRAVVHIIQENLESGEAPYIAAKKVASAAMQSGAQGPVSVMVLVFPTVKASQKETVPQPKKRLSRPSGLRRHTSNADQQLNSVKAAKSISNTPAFVRAAKAETEQKRVFLQNEPQFSPITSPRGRMMRSSDSPHRTPHQEDVKTSTPFSLHDKQSGVSRRIERSFQTPDAKKMNGGKSEESQKKRADSALGIESEAMNMGYDNEVSYSRVQIDLQRRTPGERMVQESRGVRSSNRSKTTVVSRISELTASGTTTDEARGYGDIVEPYSDFVESISLGPSKVRYRDDGTVHSGRFGLFKDLLGKTFVGKR